MTTKFEIQKRKIWAEKERDLGQPIPQKLRNALENEFLSQDHDPETDLTDFKIDLDRWFRLSPLAPELYALGTTNNKGQAETDSGGTTPKKRYQKCFKRRSRIVEFVAGKVLITVNLAFEKFTPHRRIKWGAVCDQWNKAHPYDLMTPAVLKVEYYRATKDKDIHREYFGSMAEWMGPMRESILRLIGTEDRRELMKEKPMPEDEAFEILYREIIKLEREAQGEDSNTTKRADLHRGGGRG